MDCSQPHSVSLRWLVARFVEHTRRCGAASAKRVWRGRKRGSSAGFRCGALCLIAALWSSPASAAEPFLLFLLNILGRQVASTTAEASRPEQRPGLATAIPQQEPPTAAAPPEAQKLRILIDQCFGYLSQAQREETHSGLMRILSDPQHARMKPVIIQEFAWKAAAVCDAQRRLAALSDGEKRALAAQARDEYRRLPEHEREQMIAILRSGAAPLPRDLNEMILAEFAGVPPAGAAARRPE